MAQKDSIKTAAGRQLLERRDALLHQAVQDAIAVVNRAAGAPDEAEQLILCGSGARFVHLIDVRSSSGNVEVLIAAVQSQIASLSSTYDSVASNENEGVTIAFRCR